MGKKILMILQGTFPPDIRLEKETKTLSIYGYQILVVCNQYRKENPKTYKYCKISRLGTPFKSEKLNRIINFPIFFNPRLLLKLYFEIRKFKPNFLHAHDLPMLPLGIFFGRIFNIPVISDMHENYPAALEEFKKSGLFNFLFKNPSAARKLEKFCLLRADRVITVIEENSERIKKMGVDQSKIFKISNTVDLDTFTKFSRDPEIEKKYSGKFTLIYTGYVTPERGLETPIKGMKYLIPSIPNGRLLIIGDGLSIKDLKILAINENVEKFVEFIKWPSHEKIGCYISIADVCLCPQPYNEHWNNSIAHKLFEYMSYSKKILTTDAIPFKRIITETNAGLFFKSNDPIDFSNKIIELYRTNINYGENGKKAVNQKYNWAEDSKELLRLYNSFNL